MWHKVAVFLLVSHTALLKRVFQVILWQTGLCNTPLNACRIRVISTSRFFWSRCTPTVKSLFQLSAPLRLIEPGCLPERISVHQSISGEWGRFFVVNSIFYLSNHPAGALFPNFTLVCCFEFRWSWTKPSRGHIWCRQCNWVSRALPPPPKKMVFIQQARTKSVPWAGPNGAVQGDCRNRWTASKLWSAGICSNPTQTPYRKLLLLRCRMGCGGVSCWCLSQVQTAYH